MATHEASPVIHLYDSSGWVNDPNGPLFYKGKYHMFFQNVSDTTTWTWGLSWGHASSTDLLHWKQLPPALSPEQGWHDADGCFSGCATIDEKGVPAILYTGVVKKPDAAEREGMPLTVSRMAHECQLLARPADPDDPDLKVWVKVRRPFLADDGSGLPINCWRDPFVLERPGPANDHTWRVMVGSNLQLTAEELAAQQGGGVGAGGGAADEARLTLGTALVYRSRTGDLEGDWEYEGLLCTARPGDGALWECPLMSCLPLLPFDEPAAAASTSSNTPAAAAAGRPVPRPAGPSAAATQQQQQEEVMERALSGCLGLWKPEPAAAPPQQQGAVALPPTHMFSVSAGVCPAIYWLGRYASGRFDLESADGPHALDLGDVVYAPNLLVDEQGRQIIWSWLQEHPSPISHDYAGCISLPRQLQLGVRRRPPSADGGADGDGDGADEWFLVQSPLPELAALRSGRGLRLRGIRLAPGRPWSVPSQVSASHLDLTLSIKPTHGCQHFQMLLGPLRAAQDQQQQQVQMSGPGSSEALTLPAEPQVTPGSAAEPAAAAAEADNSSSTAQPQPAASSSAGQRFVPLAVPVGEAGKATAGVGSAATTALRPLVTPATAAAGPGSPPSQRVSLDSSYCSPTGSPSANVPAVVPLMPGMSSLLAPGAASGAQQQAPAKAQASTAAAAAAAAADGSGSARSSLDEHGTALAAAAAAECVDQAHHQAAAITYEFGSGQLQVLVGPPCALLKLLKQQQDALAAQAGSGDGRGSGIAGATPAAGDDVAGDGTCQPSSRTGTPDAQSLGFEPPSLPCAPSGVLTSPAIMAAAAAAGVRMLSCQLRGLGLQQPLQLRLLLDYSILECFFGTGEALTTRVYRGLPTARAAELAARRAAVSADVASGDVHHSMSGSLANLSQLVHQASIGTHGVAGGHHGISSGRMASPHGSPPAAPHAAGAGSRVSIGSSPLSPAAEVHYFSPHRALSHVASLQRGPARVQEPPAAAPQPPAAGGEAGTDAPAPASGWGRGRRGRQRQLFAEEEDAAGGGSAAAASGDDSAAASAAAGAAHAAGGANGGGGVLAGPQAAAMTSPFSLAAAAAAVEESAPAADSGSSFPGFSPHKAPQLPSRPGAAASAESSSRTRAGGRLASWFQKVTRAKGLGAKARAAPASSSSTSGGGHNSSSTAPGSPPAVVPASFGVPVVPVLVQSSPAAAAGAAGSDVQHEHGRPGDGSDQGSGAAAPSLGGGKPAGVRSIRTGTAAATSQPAVQDTAVVADAGVLASLALAAVPGAAPVRGSLLGTSGGSNGSPTSPGSSRLSGSGSLASGRSPRRNWRSAFVFAESDDDEAASEAAHKAASAGDGAASATLHGLLPPMQGAVPREELPALGVYAQVLAAHEPAAKVASRRVTSSGYAPGVMRELSLVALGGGGVVVQRLEAHEMSSMWKEGSA